jgi:hypothetical protein
MQLSCAFGELWSIKVFGQLSILDQANCEQVAGNSDVEAIDWGYYPFDCNRESWPATTTLA